MMQSVQYFAVGFYLSAITATLFGKSTLLQIVGPLGFNFIFGVGGALLGSALTQKWGSRKLAMRGFFCSAVLLVVIGVSGPSLQGGFALVGGLLVGLFIFTHAGGPAAQGMTLATLSYPTHLRGAGTGMAQAVLRIGSIGGLTFFPIMTESFGLSALIFLAAAPVIGLLTTLLINWEPVGRDIDAEELAAARPGLAAKKGI